MMTPEETKERNEIIHRFATLQVKPDTCYCDYCALEIEDDADLILIYKVWLHPGCYNKYWNQKLYDICHNVIRNTTKNKIDLAINLIELREFIDETKDYWIDIRDVIYDKYSRMKELHQTCYPSKLSIIYYHISEMLLDFYRQK